MQKKKEIIKNRISESINIKKLLLHDEKIIKTIDAVITLCVKGVKKKKKIFFCGNGGSAADAQHLAAELSGQFYINRKPINAEALHVNTSYITAVGNDLGFDNIYARALEAKGGKGDILIGLSTSGNSNNVLKAFQSAKKMNITTIGLTGDNGGKLTTHADYLIAIPNNDIPRIQECHILIGHIICELIEKKLFA